MKWVQSIAFWIPFASAAFLCWSMLEHPGSAWVAFYSFLPMTFFFVGAAFIVVSKRVQALEDRIKALEGGGPPLDTRGNSTELRRLRFAPVVVGGMMIVALTVGGGLWHGSAMQQAALQLAWFAIVLITLLRWIYYTCPHCHQRFFIPVAKSQPLPLRRFLGEQCANCGHVLHQAS